MFLQDSTAAVAQTNTGFVPGGIYALKFYLGSRFSSAYDGNQTVEAQIDGRVIGTWALTSFSPFTLQTEPFIVSTGGSHLLSFIGTASGDHAAFFSDVSIPTAGRLTVKPSSGTPAGESRRPKRRSSRHSARTSECQEPSSR